MYGINNSPIAMAVNPASVMRDFFETFLRGSTLLLLGLSALVTVVAAVSILVSIYNAVAARMREIAILRALGATRARILTQICVEAGLIGLIGGILGLVAGHLVAGVISFYFRRTLGEGIDWLAPAPEEVIYLGGVVLIAVLAGLVPALKAYRTPVATNLVAG
jgi:putative ABC transport system permease protein